MPRFIIGDLRTGRRILDLPVTSGSWDDRLDTAETIQVSVTMNDKDVRALDLLNAATVGKSFLAAVDGDNILAAGPIWTFNYDKDKGSIDLGAKGMASMFDHRLILPLLAASLGINDWTIPDPSDSSGAKTLPNPAVASSFTGIWLGTIAKRLVQQAMTWTGGDLPILFQSDEADGDSDHDRTYQGGDFKPLGEAITELTAVDGGPEINFQPQYTTDKLGLQWQMETGTVAQPLLYSQSIPVWDVTAKESQVSGLTIGMDASKMGSLSWATGGRQDSTVLVARAYDPTLVNAGYPLMEVLDSSHTSVSEQATLDGYAQAGVAAALSPMATWAFSVRAHPIDSKGRPAGPNVGEYAVGDFWDLKFVRFDGKYGDPLLKDGGTFRVRVVGLGGDMSEKIAVSCAPFAGN